HPSSTDRTWTSIYDAGGLLTQDKQPGGITITNTYDALARLITQTTGALTKTIGYDVTSRPTTFSHPAGTQTLVYDDRSLTVGAAGPAGNMIATYSGDSRMLTRNDPAGNHTFGYDTRGRMTTAADPLTARTLNYTFNDSSQITRVDYGTPGGSTPYREYGYDTIGRLTTDTSKTGGGTTKQSSTYSYDADSNVTQQVLSMPGAGNTAEGTYDYSYDRAGRLTRFNRTSGSTMTTDYRWDAAGNRAAVVTNAVVQSWTYDQRNRITTGPEGTYTWDPRGTLDKIMNGATTVNDATFDNFGRMTAMTVSGSTINYTYDALDRMATRNVGTNQTFAYNGASIDPSLAAGIKYSRSPSERLLGVQNGATTRLAGINRHGDLQFLLDTSGNATDTSVYDPFGKPIQTTGTTGANVGFQGDFTDPTSADVWMGARWYAPSTATFRSRDTIRGELSTPISLNRYTYAAGNPISFMDPDGHYYDVICFDVCVEYWVDDPVYYEPVPYYDPCAWGGCWDYYEPPPPPAYDPCAYDMWSCADFSYTPPPPEPVYDPCAIDPWACYVAVDVAPPPPPPPPPVYDPCAYDMWSCADFSYTPPPEPATAVATDTWVEDMSRTTDEDIDVAWWITEIGFNPGYDAAAEQAYREQQEMLNAATIDAFGYSMYDADEVADAAWEQFERQQAVENAYLGTLPATGETAMFSAAAEERFNACKYGTDCGDWLNGEVTVGAAPDWSFFKKAADVASYAPVVGDFVDAGRAAINLAQGDWEDAFIYSLGVVPIPGVTGTSARLGREGIEEVTEGAAQRELPKSLFRFGVDPESADDLARQAAAAQAEGLPHGVSTFSRSSRPDAVKANAPDVDAVFPVIKTRGPYHYTVELPDPVTDDVAEIFNQLFGR
ncbi:MAG: RHS repeat-associated core domain-containing protein, partial [Acidimicrobiales bacterium]